MKRRAMLCLCLLVLAALNAGARVRAEGAQADSAAGTWTGTW
jgi:hypothetical protein